MNFQTLPGPSGYPIFGNYFSIDGPTFFKQATDWSEEFGPIYRCSALGTQMVIISSVKLMKEAFKKQPDDAANHRPDMVLFYDVFQHNDILSCPDLPTVGRMKGYLRRALANMLNKRGRDTAAFFRQNLRRLITDEEDFTTTLKEITYDFMSYQLLGDVIPDDHPDRDIPWQFVENVFLLIQPSVDGPLKTFPFLKRLPGYYGNVYSQTIETRDKVAKMYFEDHKESYIHGKVRGLVDVCLKTQEDEISATESTWLTDEYIKGLVFDTLSAGMTELTKTLRLFVLLMCHYPKCQTKIQSEIDAAIGTEVYPSVAVMSEMPYTEAVILEVLRYGSQTQLGIPHHCRKDILVDGYIIEKGSVIFPNLYGIHHDEKIWGDPWQFRPSRFLGEFGRLLPSDHMYMQNLVPFSVGKRSCPGQDFARSRVFLAVTSLLQRTRILPPVQSELPSADPRLYTKDYPLNEPEFTCQIVCRDNMIL